MPTACVQSGTYSRPKMSLKCGPNSMPLSVKPARRTKPQELNPIGSRSGHQYHLRVTVDSTRQQQHTGHVIHHLINTPGGSIGVPTVATEK